MKHLLALSVLISLAACQPSETKSDMAVQDVAATPVVSSDVVEDQVRIILGEPVAEARACILPITVANGLDGNVTITMIGFTVGGPGEDTQANMFAPAAAPGETSEPRVILEGQSCDAFDTVQVENIQCKVDGESCNAALDYVDHPQMGFSTDG